MSIVVTLQSGLHMLYLGQRRSYFSKVNKVLLAKLIFQHFERYAFVCYFMLHLITMLSLFPCISLEAKLKGRQNTPMPGVMQSQSWVPAPCSTFLHDWGPSCWCPEKLFELHSQSVCPSCPSFPACTLHPVIRTCLLSRCVGACQANKYSEDVRSSDAPANGQKK